jgi:hypothetical protein
VGELANCQDEQMHRVENLVAHQERVTVRPEPSLMMVARW